MSLTFSELIEEINKELACYDCESLASLAQDILFKKVDYMGDGLFEVKSYFPTSSEV